MLEKRLKSIFLCCKTQGFRALTLGAVCTASWLALPQQASAQSAAPSALPPVSVSAKANRNPVEKSYRRMLRGMDLFEQNASIRAPGAELRFKLLPRKRSTLMQDIKMTVIGDKDLEFAVPIAADGTFALPRNALAVAEDAQVIPNRPAGSMTWRAEVRSPGLPPGERRLGDLRLECRVGMEAGLTSSGATLMGRLVGSVLYTPAFCDRKIPEYLFFADRALFSVTLSAGNRQEILPIHMLYAGASENPQLGAELPDCDCEALVDRTYFLPLGDLSWPDDTRVRFEFMEGGAP